jgi:hypothetical protein
MFRRLSLGTQPDAQRTAMIRDRRLEARHDADLPPGPSTASITDVRIGQGVSGHAGGHG